MALLPSNHHLLVRHGTNAGSMDQSGHTSENIIGIHSSHARGIENESSAKLESANLLIDRQTGLRASAVQELPEEILVEILLSLGPLSLGTPSFLECRAKPVFVQTLPFSEFYDSQYSTGIFSNPLASVCKQWKRVLSSKPFVCNLYLLYPYSKGVAGVAPGRVQAAQRIVRWLASTGSTFLNIHVQDPSHGGFVHLEHVLPHYCLPRIIAMDYGQIGGLFDTFLKPKGQLGTVALCPAENIRRLRFGSKFDEPALRKPVSMPRLEFLSYTGTQIRELLLKLRTPCVNTLKLPFAILGTPEFLELPAHYPLLQDIQISLPSILSENFTFPFKTVRRVTTVVCKQAHGISLLSFDDCPLLDALDIEERKLGWFDRGIFTISSSSLTTFTYRTTRGFGYPLALHPNIFLSLPNLECCHLINTEIFSEEEPRLGKNDLFLSGLLRNNELGTLPSPRLSTLWGEDLDISPQVLLDILRERRLDSPGSVRECFVTWSWNPNDNYFPHTVKQNYEQFASKFSTWQNETQKDR